MDLPEAFDMSVKLSVSGIQQPFEFVVPVKNLAKESIVLHPAQTQSSGDFSYTVKQLELTPVTVWFWTAKVKFLQLRNKREI